MAHNFDRIEMGEMPPNIDEWKIRDDQRYLYEMVLAVHRGVCDDRLASLKPGALNLSRWLTTASRILRLYVTQPVASPELSMMAFFVMKVYAPFWFLVKDQPQGMHGSRHLFKYIQWTRQLPQDIQAVVQRSIQINGFFCHPENILLSMITDANKEVRVEGYNKILDSRVNPRDNIRQFIVPEIKFDCDSYTKMIDWNAVGPITEPPCIQFYPQMSLLEHHDSDEIIEIPGKMNIPSKKHDSDIDINFCSRISMPFAKHRAICETRKRVVLICD